MLYWNEEFRSTIWGHMTLLNLKQLVEPIFTGFKHTTHPYDVPTNADIADHTHEQGGLVNYTHPAQNLQDPYDSAYSAKEMPIDVALGKIDSIDVMGSNHQANMPLWYRLLNCGFRVPASAGTDCFLNRIASRLPGSDRVYVHCRRASSPTQTGSTSLQAGRTFVTNGPMLRAVAAGRPLGETVRLAGPGGVRVGRPGGSAQFPLDRHRGAVQRPGGGDGRARRRSGREVPVDQTVKIEAQRLAGLASPGRRPRAMRRVSRPGLRPHEGDLCGGRGRPIQRRVRTRVLPGLDRPAVEQVRKRNRIPAARQAHVEEQIAAGKAFYQKVAAHPAGCPRSSATIAHVEGSSSRARTRATSPHGAGVGWDPAGRGERAVAVEADLQRLGHHLRVVGERPPQRPAHVAASSASSTPRAASRTRPAASS